MFNTGSWQSHAAYRINFQNLKARFPSDLRAQLWDVFPAERRKLLSLDLDPVGEYLSRRYSGTGRPAKNQAQILRSLILFALLFNRTDAKLSLTLWVDAVLPNDPVLIALVGCASPSGLPPLGSYYDFMDRLWAAPRDRYARSFLLPAGKNGKKPKKQIGPDGKLSEPEPDTFSTRLFADRILGGEPLSDGAQSVLQDVFSLAAVMPSHRMGLIPSSPLTVSGDGTALHVHASPFGSRPRTPDAPPDTRRFSDPDAEWGHDSHEKNWYFGHTLYMLCSRNREHRVELPLLFSLTGAKRHDSINFLYAFDAFTRHLPELHPDNVCLDSAHDNIPTYELLEHWDMSAIIDINGRNSNAEGLPDDISMDKNGHPHCMAGHRMCPWGFDRSKGTFKYRCPLKCGRVRECPCSAKCSGSGYGRTVQIKKNGHLRFYPRIPRGSALFRSVYSERTACERLNNRVLNDYHLQDLHVRGIDHFSFWSMVIGICIHLDAWANTGMIPA